jgi:pimeloyl-ACP methyl ester carboxylesterase
MLAAINYLYINGSFVNCLHMPIDKINGVKLYWELNGSQGDPMVFVHGSWGDHHNWDRVAGELSRTFQVLTYDRRGHSESERLSQQGSMEEDVADLIALIEHLHLAPAHIIGNSGGSAVALKTAAKNPALFRTLVIHEPALFGLLKDVSEARPFLHEVESRIAAVVSLIEKGENDEAARCFVETIAFGPGAWQGLPPQVQQTFIYNAPTFLDETKDPNSLELDISKLSKFTKPALLSSGTQSPPFFLMVLDKLSRALPHAKRTVFEGAGHVPHLSHPAQYIQVVREYCLTNPMAT